MRLLFIADGRSPIALNWIRYLLEGDDEVHLVSTFDCDPDPRFASFTFIPVAFSELKSKNKSGSPGASRRLSSSASLRTRLRQWFGPLTLGNAASRLATIIESIHPDLIHAMRIPYEGMLAAMAAGKLSPQASARLLVSVWGNDFTLHASSTPLMRRFTHRTLLQANALHTDCNRDVRLARIWGFSEAKPVIVLPGAGGVQLDVFYPPPAPVAGPVVINPRGFRLYVNNAAFFQSIRQVLRKYPQARFVCPAMAGEPLARHWLKSMGIGPNVELLPVQTPLQMAELFRGSRLAVSPSNHDGTPNTLLEAMACGCLPVAGDLESLREWITPGVNGLLVDPNDPAALAESILLGLADDDLQKKARAINSEIIANRADHQAVMLSAVSFYKQLIGG